MHLILVDPVASTLVQHEGWTFGCAIDCCHHPYFWPVPDMTNPLLDLSGLPRFTRIQPNHVEPAVDQVLNENRRRIDEIAAESQPSWENVVAPMEQMEHRLSRVWAPVGHLNAVMNSESLREAYNECLPKLSEYSTTVGQNESAVSGLRGRSQIVTAAGPRATESYRARAHATSALPVSICHRTRS